MDFQIDFSNIEWLEIRKLGITMEEVFEVIQNPNSPIGFVGDASFLIGFTSKRKFIVVAYDISKNINFDTEVTDIDLPYEEDISKIWCPYQRRN